MFHVALFEPEIPPNTGNIIRLCANTGSQLHLIRPLGFELNDKQLKRAGLDYHEWVNIKMYDDFLSFMEEQKERRLFACSTKGQLRYDQVAYQSDDILLFGPETRGLSNEILKTFSVENVIRIPMVPNNRSLNLSNAVAVILYEAWRQHDYRGCLQFAMPCINR